jgi:hypothetical protein
MMNDKMNQLLGGNTLCSDGAEHDALRGVIVRPLMSKALRPLREDVPRMRTRWWIDWSSRARRRFRADTASSGHRVQGDRAAGKGTGPDAGLAEQMFNYFGPLNDGTVESFPILNEMTGYARNGAVP